MVVSAPWVRDELTETIAYFADKIRNGPDKEELLKISAIFPLDPSGEFVQEIIAESSEYRNGVLRNVEVAGIEIKRAYILTPTSRQYTQFGSAKGLISMSDDFDEPLEDFKDSM